MPIQPTKDLGTFERLAELEKIPSETYPTPSYNPQQCLPPRGQLVADVPSPASNVFSVSCILQASPVSSAPSAPDSMLANSADWQDLYVSENSKHGHEHALARAGRVNPSARCSARRARIPQQRRNNRHPVPTSTPHDQTSRLDFVITTHSVMIRRGRRPALPLALGRCTPTGSTSGSTTSRQRAIVPPRRRALRNPASSTGATRTDLVIPAHAAQPGAAPHAGRPRRHVHVVIPHGGVVGRRAVAALEIPARQPHVHVPRPGGAGVVPRAGARGRRGQDDVPGVQEAGDVAEEEEDEVEQGVCAEEAAADGDGEGGEEDGEEEEQRCA